MIYQGFEDVMRRIVTGDDADGRSTIIIDGPPSGGIGDPNLGGLSEIWHEAVNGAIDARDHTDRGEKTSILSPAAGNVKVRWFMIQPAPDGIDPELLKAAAKQRFGDFGAAHELRDQNRHPAMHQTQTLDIICLISGDASLVLDNTETRIKPGQIVIQRGTSHGWTAHGGPALFLAILIDRH